MIQAIGRNVIVKLVKEEKSTKGSLMFVAPIEIYEVVSVGSAVRDIRVLDRIYTRFALQSIPGEIDLFVTDCEGVYAKKS